MAFDPYSPCPCGSGEKFKWCCHKVESYADRAQRLVETGQIDLALQTLEEGLRKEPGNAWLLTRKALIQIRADQADQAIATLRLILEKRPTHAGALILLTRLLLETEGPAAGARLLQEALSAFEPAKRSELGLLVRYVANVLTESGVVPAAVRHMELAQSLLGPEGDPKLAAATRALQANHAISLWRKNPDTFLPAPTGLSEPATERFNQAVGWALVGLWGQAAKEFEALSDDPVAGPRACRNLAFCRLYMVDSAAAVPLFRRYIASLGPTTEAVDLEVLAQEFDVPKGDDLVEKVELTWPLRDRARLIEILKADNTYLEEGEGPIDPDDPNSAEVARFAILDRPRIENASPDLVFSDIPQVVGRLNVEQDKVKLETFDDGRMDALAERFMATASTTIPPAHPKTKAIAKAPRQDLALAWEWLMPEGVEPERVRALNDAQTAHLINHVWVKTPHRALRRRTPLQAAQAGDAEVPLRATVLRFERTIRQSAIASGRMDFEALRRTLKIPPEPSIDPATVDINTVHLARLALVPVDRLDDDKLAAYYRRARQFAIDDALERSALLIVDRPGVLDRPDIGPFSVYSDLAGLAAGDDRLEESAAWIRRGREAGASASKPVHPAAWDLLELRITATQAAPEVWVPAIGVVLDRYQADPRGTQIVLMNLIEMGILELRPNPENPSEMHLDTSKLATLMSRYGPRVTTASGRLGVSATKPAIWTPGSAPGGGAGGGLWTPGSAPAAASPPPPGPSKLILPGR